MQAARLARVALVISVCLLCSLPALAGFRATDVFLPMVGRRPGIHPSNWYTKLWVYNPNATAVDVTIYLLERSTSNPNPPFYTETIQPGDTRLYENAVFTLFGLEVYGAMRVVATDRVVVSSRVYSQATGADEEDSVGQFFAGVPASFAIGLGETSEILGVHQTVPAGDSEFRYNFGFVETTGNNATVRVTAWDETGVQQGQKDFQVREWSQRQVAFKDHFPAVSTENSRLTVEVVSGEGKIIAYGSGIANGSQDPSTFETTYPEMPVFSDATLVGDGREESPLGLADNAVTSAKILDGAVGSGDLADEAVTTAKLASNAVTTNKIASSSVTTAKLADGAVTPAKINTTGAASGQVLKVGSPAQWATDGLALPYEGSASVLYGAVFAVENSTSAGLWNAMGFQASGGDAGCYFYATEDSGYAYLGARDVGIWAGGSAYAGYFNGDVKATGEVSFSPNVALYRTSTSSITESCTFWVAHTFCALTLVSHTYMEGSSRSAYCHVLSDGQGKWRVCARGNSVTVADCQMSCF